MPRVTITVIVVCRVNCVHILMRDEPFVTGNVLCSLMWMFTNERCHIHYKHALCGLIKCASMPNSLIVSMQYACYYFIKSALWLRCPVDDY